VLFECLTGRRAFDGASMTDVLAAIVGGNIDWRVLPETTPAPLSSLLRRCLETDVRARLRDIGEARVQLEQIASGAGDGAASAEAEARAACRARDWRTAFSLLTAADVRGEVGPEGLELLAECARWAGHYEGLCDPLERAHAAYAARDDRRGAVRTALELCNVNIDANRNSTAEVWWKRADALIGGLPDCAEHALHAWFASRMSSWQGDVDGNERDAQRALDLARRHGDRSVEALATIELAHVATRRGENAAALELIDHATALALGGEAGLFASGLVFCNAIWACRCRGDWQRAQEWTDSATRWVKRHQVDYFPGMCRVHRAEVLRIRGDLAAAEAECEAATELAQRAAPGQASFPWAELGEVRRRRGNAPGAMAAFRRALELGWDPQPGLALLMLAQGDAASAHRAMERAFAEPRPTLLHEDRANMLCARARIALAAGRREIAVTAVEELAARAAHDGLPWDAAAAAHAAGVLALADGDAPAAIQHLTQARRAWAGLETPYELATTCALLGEALAADGDLASARLELEAARDAFARIGAEHDRQYAAERLAILDGGRTDTAPTSAADEATMRREGDVWALTFEGRTVRLQCTRGLDHLASLLAQPDVDLWAVDLAAPRDAAGCADAGDAGALLDTQARADYRRRARELERELAGIDAGTEPQRAERLRSELDALGSQLAAAVGLGGRPRKAGSAVERARQSVTKALRATLRRIAAEHPALGRHLQDAIRTGTACRFESNPRDPVTWCVQR
jgi:tetratricopeptide (TPR) repeat protein